MGRWGGDSGDQVKDIIPQQVEIVVGKAKETIKKVQQIIPRGPRLVAQLDRLPSLLPLARINPQPINPQAPGRIKDDAHQRVQTALRIIALEVRQDQHGEWGQQLDQDQEVSVAGPAGQGRLQ